MKKILVLGAGQGGMVAAIKLAEAGYDVTVLEAAKEGEVGYPWYDDIRHDIFDLVGIPEPPREDYTQKSKWIFLSPDNESSLIVPPLPPMEEIAVSRRGLSKHLIKLATDAGATVKCGQTVKELIVKKNQVVGAKTARKKYYADLVIDASGLRSPFRAQVPKKFHIEAQPKDSEVLSVYRGFFERNPGSPTPDPESTLTVFHNDRCGISWCNLNDRNEVDVLIGTFGGQTKEQQKEAIEDLRKRNAILSDKKIVDRWVDLGVRCTLSVMVADGYAAVGNSAYMTMPFLGSGIEASMKAGNMLAQAVIEAGDKKKGVFTAKQLWPYQVAYFKALGNVYIAVDLLKRWALSQTPETVNYLLGCGAVTSEDMKLLSTDESGESQDFKITLPDIIRRVKLITACDGLISGVAGAAVHAGHGLLISLRMPKKYNARKVRKWQKKYDGILQ